MPTALFPSQIATDAQLKVAANLIETKLRIAINATDTVLFVASTVGFAPDMLVSIDKEIIAIGAVSPAPDSTLTVATGGRGFDGTTAASHAANVKVSLLIDAWHHNALAAEVTAIQTALGPNLTNISAGGINSGAYDWAAQTPGGSLIVGNNVITLAPVPLGVNGTDTDHWLYISGGTGTAEAVLITGGTAVSGEASGTLIVNCANAHSGAWTIRSATAGIQEALQVAAPTNGATIQIPAGVLTLYAPVTVSLEGARIIGTTRNNVLGYIYCPSGVAFDVKAGSVELAYMAIRGGATAGVAAPAGNIGIRIATSSAPRGHYHDLMMDYLYGGVLHVAGFHTEINSIWCRNLSGYAVKVSGGVSPFVHHITCDTDSPNDVPAEAGIVVNAPGVYITDVDILHARYGILVQPTTSRLEWTFIYDTRLDQCYTNGVYILNSSAFEIEGVFLRDVWSCSAGLSGTLAGAPPTAGCGLVIENTAGGAIKEVVVVSGQIFNNRDQNVRIQWGENVKLDGVRLNWANQGVSANIDNIYVASPFTVEITNCEIGSQAPGSAVALRSGILADAPTGSLVIRDNRFNTQNGAFSSQPIVSLATTGANVRNAGFNAGSDDIPYVVASAATLTLGPRAYFHITGTTNINTIGPTWQGRKIYLHNPDAGSWQLTSSGNIAGPLTVSSGTSVALVFVGAKWLAGN